MSKVGYLRALQPPAPSARPFRKTADLPSISVVICAGSYHRWSKLERAVASVHEQDYEAHEVLVVVDRDPRLAARARATLDARVIQTRDSIGEGAARNEAARQSTGDVIAFLDDDAWAQPGWLEYMARRYEDAAVIGVGGSTFPMWPHDDRPDWLPPEFDWVVGCTYRGLPRSAVRVRNLATASFSVRRNVFAEIGGFRPAASKTVANSPDKDLCLRASERMPSGRWVYEPSAIVHNTISPDRTRVRYFAQQCHYEGIGRARIAESFPHLGTLGMERNYVRTTISRAVMRDLGAAWHGDRHGINRIGATFLGLAMAGAGFARQRLGAA